MKGWVMKKVILAFLLLALMLLSAASAEEAPPETLTSLGFQYIVLEDGSVQITSYIGEEAEVTVPETLDGKPVREIGRKPFPAAG